MGALRSSIALGRRQREEAINLFLADDLGLPVALLGRARGRVEALLRPAVVIDLELDFARGAAVDSLTALVAWLWLQAADPGGSQP